MIYDICREASSVSARSMFIRNSFASLKLTSPIAYFVSNKVTG